MPSLEEEIKDTLCDSDEAFCIARIIFTNQIHSTKPLSTHSPSAASRAAPGAGVTHRLRRRPQPTVTLAGDHAPTAARLQNHHLGNAPSFSTTTLALPGLKRRNWIQLTSAEVWEQTVPTALSSTDFVYRVEVAEFLLKETFKSGELNQC